MSLPKRLYYPISLAADKLQCSVADLIHFGATSAVEVCINLSFINGSLSFDYNESGIESVLKKDNDFFIGKYNFFELNKVDDVIYINNFYGLAALPASDLISIDLNPDAPIFINHIFCPDGNGILFDDLTGAVYIEPSGGCIERVESNDLIKRMFITDTEMNKLMDSAHNNTHPNIPDSVRKKSSKTTNMQAKFIKSLLQIHYGADVANNPRQHLEEKKSGAGTILSDFNAVGLKAPSGVVVDRWLKFVDIDGDD